MSGSVLPVAFCVDRNILPGLHVTLFSTLLHLRRNVHLDVHIYTDSLTETDLEQLAATCDATRHPYSLQKHTIDLAAFRRLRWHGGWMTYARILVPEEINVERFCFLDADLLVYADLAELFSEDLRPHALGAASWGSISASNDRAFFAQRGFGLEKPYFNAGVLLIDVCRWRNQRITDACFEAIAKFGTRLPTVDQTILNVVFYDKFHQIPRRFNTPVTASRRPLRAADLANRVIHLVGHPKPWEYLGFLNGQYFHYRQLARRIQLALPSAPQTLLRRVRYARAYIKCLPNAIRLLLSRSWCFYG
jgi:lipopolysaccharide biosynthesis glycosyltransferase